MADARALTIQGGRYTQIQDADELQVGGGIDRATSGILTIGSAVATGLDLGGAGIASIRSFTDDIEFQDVAGNATGISRLTAAVPGGQTYFLGQGASVNGDAAGEIFIKAGTCGAANTTGTGGALYLESGGGSGAAVSSSGEVDIRSSNTSLLATGGATGVVTLASGNAKAGASGTVTVQSGTTATSGNSGLVTVISGNSAATSGDVRMDVGTGVTPGTLLLGNTNATAITLGSGSTTTTCAGILSVTTLQTTNLQLTNAGGTNYVRVAAGALANLEVHSANATGATASGTLSLRSGTTTAGASGAVTLQSGNATAGASGQVNIVSGTSSSTTSGVVYIDSGVGTGSNGVINIGTANAPDINFGGAATTLSLTGIVDTVVRTSNGGFQRTAVGTMSLGTDANSTQVDVGTHADCALINIGTGMTLPADEIRLGGGGAGGSLVKVFGDFQVVGNEVINGNTTIDTDLWVKGDTIIGDPAGDDTLAIRAYVGPAGDLDMHFVKSENHTIDVVASSVAADPGGDLTLAAGKGATSAAGGTMAVVGGAGDTTGAGGVLNLTSGAGGATSGASGAVNLKSGAVVSGNSGNLTIASGNTALGTSGNVSIDAGTFTVAGGTITIGGTSAASVEIGAAAIPTNVNGALTVDGNTTLGNATGDSLTVYCGTQTFTNDADHFILVNTTAAGVAGKRLWVLGGSGGAASGGAAGAGGNMFVSGGTGGAADAANTGAVGGSGMSEGGVGGAGSATAAAGAGGQNEIRGGAAGADGGGGGANGGNLYVKGGAKSGTGLNGNLYLGETDTYDIFLGSSGNNRHIEIGDSANTGSVGITSGSTAATGITLASGGVTCLATTDVGGGLGWSISTFDIGGTAATVGSGANQVNGTNLNTLVGGGNADALHTHAGGSATFVSFTGTSGAAVTQYSLVAMNNSGGNPRVYMADANGGTPTYNPVGITRTVAVGAGTSLTIQVDGEIAIPDALWDVVPVVGDVGKLVYMSTTAGNFTITAPSTSGDMVQKVGVVTVGGSGAVKLVIQFGDGTLL